jgi:ubiquitin-like modifier-activating enzyme 5
MLTRCGIGKLILYDYDRVELANMNRLFYTPQQVGLSKVEAAKETLQGINPKVVIEAMNANITTNDNYLGLLERIHKGGLDGGRISLVLSCVDNYAARMCLNRACNEVDQIWFESGVSEDAMSAHIQIMVPGETACFACASPLAVVEENEGSIKREGVCAASLPTTMGVTAGFLAQNALKFLLDFGELAFCLSYNAKKDFFSNYMIRPNPECKDGWCVKRQQEKAAKPGPSYLEQREAKVNPKAAHKESEPVHKENEWGIEIVSQEEVKQEPVSAHVQVVKPAGSGQEQPAPQQPVAGGESLEDLMNKLKMSN